MTNNYIPYNMPPSTVQKIIIAFEYLVSHNEKMCCDDPLLVWTLGCTKCGKKIGTLPELPWTPQRAIVRIGTYLDDIDGTFNYEKIAEEYKEMDKPIPEVYEWGKGNHVEEYREELLIEIDKAYEQVEKIDEILGKMCLYGDTEESIKSATAPIEESQLDSKSKKKAKGKRESS
jgi:hypothetical protein